MRAWMVASSTSALVSWRQKTPKICIELTFPLTTTLPP
jgi:hypothetical protein